MQQITQMIRQIDRDRNGYITTSEMDDILKEVYPMAFKNKCFKAIFRPFTAIQNPILLNYNQFRDFVNSVVKPAPLNNDESKLAAKGIISVADLFKSRKAPQPEDDSETKSISRSYQSNANLTGN
jgi:Ca2+-binding EF-hand superfamily protein